MWSIHAMEYYSTAKKNEVLVRVTMRMKLKNAMRDERSPSQKTTPCMIPFTENAQNTTESQAVDSWLPRTTIEGLGSEH